MGSSLACQEEPSNSHHVLVRLLCRSSHEGRYRQDFSKGGNMCMYKYVSRLCVCQRWEGLKNATKAPSYPVSPGCCCYSCAVSDSAKFRTSQLRAVVSSLGLPSFPSQENLP